MNLQAESKARSVYIRWMITRDMAEVLEIESSLPAFPWYREDYVRVLRQRNCIGMVAERDEKVVGAFIYELFRNRLEIHRFAVHPHHARTGVGRSMVKKLINKLSPSRNRIFIRLRETSLDATLFFQAMGFRAVSLLRGCYADTGEDGYLMQYRYPPGGGSESCA